jgi:hypothetical protein
MFQLKVCKKPDSYIQKQDHGRSRSEISQFRSTVRHLVSDKNFSPMKKRRLKYKPNTINRTQKRSKLTELWTKNQFFCHFENRSYFENQWKELPIFFKI